MESKKELKDNLDESFNRHQILKALQDQITGINSMLLHIGCPLQVYPHPLLGGDSYKSWMKDYKKMEDLFKEKE